MIYYFNNPKWRNNILWNPLNLYWTKLKKLNKKKAILMKFQPKNSGIPISTLNKILSSVIKDPKIGTLIAITDAWMLI